MTTAPPATPSPPRAAPLQGESVKLSHFFIDRPIFAAVLSTFIFIAGAIAITQLPVSEYPEVVPPSVIVRAHLPGRKPEGRGEHRRRAARAGDRRRRGHALHVLDLDHGRLAGSDRHLPRRGGYRPRADAGAEPRAAGVAATAGGGARPGCDHHQELAQPDDGRAPYSPDGRYDTLYLRNYAVRNVRDVLARLPGMGDVQLFGGGDYAMRDLARSPEARRPQSDCR